MNVEIGQVLSMIIRFNNSGLVSSQKHPYLIVKIIDSNTIEVAQLDKVRGKWWKAAFESNKVIYSENPHETVIDEDSFIQNDNTIQIEYFDEIVQFRRQKDTLSSKKLADVVNEYNLYHMNHQIDEDKQVYISKEELLFLNSN